VTYEEYLEGLGVPKSEIPREVEAMRARYARELEQAADAIEDGCVLTDPMVADSPWG
jgi:hypothetical protein